MLDDDARRHRRVLGQDRRPRVARAARPRGARRGSGWACSTRSCCARRWAGCPCPDRGSPRRSCATLIALRLGRRRAARRSRRRPTGGPRSPSRSAAPVIRSTTSRPPPAGAGERLDARRPEAGRARRPHRRRRLRRGPRRRRARRPSRVDEPGRRAGPEPRRHPQDGPPACSTAGRPAASVRPAISAHSSPASIDDIGIALCAESVGACDRALRDGHRVRQGPRAVRPADRHLPGDQAQDRRHAPPARAGPGRHPLRGVGQRCRRSRSGPRRRPWPRASWPRRPR